MTELLTTTEFEPTSCRSVHPEDLKAGDFVTPMRQRYEVCTYIWCGLDTHQYPPHLPVEIAMLCEFELVEVKEVCFPFVVGSNHDGGVAVLDTRRMELGLVSQSFADAWKQLADAKSKQKADRGSKSRKKKKRKRNR